MLPSVVRCQSSVVIMEGKLLYVCALFAVVFVLVQPSSAIRCHTCVGAATNQDCMDNGVISECSSEFDACQISIISDTNGVPSITKTCAVQSVCEVQVVPERCTGLYSSLSACYCCCNDSDKCNSALCGLTEENNCVPWSGSGSKKSGSKKSGSKKSGSKSHSHSHSHSKSKSKKSGSKSIEYCEDAGVALVASPILLVCALAAKLW